MSDFLIADDLSGALDAAAAFHRAGQRVTIPLSLEAWAVSLNAGEVVAFTTETRNAAPTVAMEAVTRAIAHGRGRGARLVYKKIDSTLRGPVAAELAALEAALPDVRILFAPANPAVGRTVRNGVLRVHGVPLAETEFGRDPVAPVRESSIRRLLGDAATARVTIADAETEEHLTAAVADIAATGEPWVAVGSGALARPVAANRCGEWKVAPDLTMTSLGGPLLFVCGSAHPANRAQAEWLTRNHAVPVHEIEVTTSGTAKAAKAAVASMAKQGAAMIVLQSARVESGAALAAITAAASAVIADTNARRVFVTGGETAFALCGALGISALEFAAELEPGLCLARANARTGQMIFAIKNGGFGQEPAWGRAWNGLEDTR